MEDPKELSQAEVLQKFLSDTKERFDKYFNEVGYVCFIFNKKTHKGESVYVSNAPEDVAGIVEPYANANNIETQRQKKVKLRSLRR